VNTILLVNGIHIIVALHKDGGPMSRRERLRDNTREEIKALARTQMATSGSAALSLGAIARAMEMVPSALYRYYASRDDLITALIVDAFDALGQAAADADAQAAASDYGARMLATTLAYRAWALANPADFLLIFGTPIPGYDAPPEPTNAAVRRAFSVFLRILQAAYAAGALRPPPEHEQQAARQSLERHTDADTEILIAPVVNYTGMACWARMHGLVILEVTQHLQPGIADTAAFYHAEMIATLKSIGLDPHDTS
jgi:AcrR family transcriptional regulator